MRAQIVFGIRLKSFVPYWFICSGVIKNNVVGFSHTPSVIMRGISFPHDLISEHRTSKHGIQHQFQKMAGCRVTMQVQAACFFQHPVHLYHPFGHKQDIGQHTTSPQQDVHSLSKMANSAPTMQQPVIYRFMFCAVPEPDIGKSLNLCCILPHLRAKQHIVILL